MSSIFVIGVVIILWVFVLTPLILRGQKPIRKTNDALEETRVVFQGGSGTYRTKRAPKVTAADVHRSALPPVAVAAETVVAEPVEQGEDLTAEELPPAEELIVEGDVAAEEFADDVAAADVNVEVDVAADADLEAKADVEDDFDPAELETQPRYELAETMLDVDDVFLESTCRVRSYTPPAPEAEVIPVPAVAEEEVAAQPVEEEESTELSAEDLAFAATRRGRGGFDPERDARARATRYQRRQRTFLGLAAFTVVGLVLAVVLGGSWWVLPGLGLTLSVAYLVTLRRVVRAEQQLRARRIAHMRRSRLGVVNAERAAELGFPARLRHPGAVVLEIDDDSPDFMDLPEMDLPATPVVPEPQRRVS